MKFRVKYKEPVKSEVPCYNGDTKEIDYEVESLLSLLSTWGSCHKAFPLLEVYEKREGKKDKKVWPSEEKPVKHYNITWSSSTTTTAPCAYNPHEGKSAKEVRDRCNHRYQVEQKNSHMKVIRVDDAETGTQVWPKQKRYTVWIGPAGIKPFASGNLGFREGYMANSPQEAVDAYEGKYGGNVHHVVGPSGRIVWPKSMKEQKEQKDE